MSANVAMYGGELALAHREVGDKSAEAPACDYGDGPDAEVTLVNCSGTCELTTGCTKCCGGIAETALRFGRGMEACTYTLTLGVVEDVDSVMTIIVDGDMGA